MWTTEAAPVPTTTYANLNVGSVTCPIVGSCVAVGYYTDNTGAQRDLFDRLSKGRWTASEAALPANAAINPSSYLYDVTCPDIHSCVAIGCYLDSFGYENAVIDTMSKRSWTVSESPLPANAAADAQSDLSDVTCPAVGSCVALGAYAMKGAYVEQDLIVTLSNGRWSAIEAPLPANTAAHPFGRLLTVTCPTVGSCVAVGYTDIGVGEGLVETLSRGRWTPTLAPLPTNANSNYQEPIGLSRVSCLTIGSCVAVGGYTDTGLNSQALVERLSGGSTPPTIASAHHPAFQLGRVNSFTVTATGNPDPSITEKGVLPRGLRFTGGMGTATISGTPASGTIGRYRITVTASNGVRPRAIMSLILIVNR